MFDIVYVNIIMICIMGVKLQFKDKTSIEMHVGTFPDRKNPCLYMMIDNICIPLAYFKSKNKADYAETMLNSICGDKKSLGELKSIYDYYSNNQLSLKKSLQSYNNKPY